MMTTQLCELSLVLVIVFYMVCAYHTQETVHFKGEEWPQIENNVLYGLITAIPEGVRINLPLPGPSQMPISTMTR